MDVSDREKTCTAPKQTKKSAFVFEFGNKNAKNAKTTFKKYT